MRPSISVVIPVLNGGSQLRSCLQGIGRQDVDADVETVVVDSGSVDGSRELAVSFGARVIEIAPEDFDHGGTRNLGVRAAGGDTVVFTTQDAFAEDPGWLRRLVAPLAEDPGVAGVYGRQLPHRDANPSECFFLDFVYGPRPRTQRATTNAELTMATTMFSNVNAAMRRTTLLQEPFVEDIIMSEDQEWVCRMLLAGHAIRYEPGAAVRHSHTYSLGQAFRRFFDSGVSADRAYLAGTAPADAALRRSAVRYAIDEVRWLARTHQLRALPSVALIELTKFVGLQLGKHHRRLPRWLNRRFSGLPNHWARAGAGPDRGERCALRLARIARGDPRRPS